MATQTTHAFPQTSDEFDDINIGGSQLYKSAPVERNRVIADLQIIMDRSGISPGVIDGLDTKRFRKALEFFNKAQTTPLSLNTVTAIASLLEDTGGDAFTTYEITAKDLRYKFTPKIPKLYVKQE